MALAAAEFRATVGQHAAELDPVLVEERHYPIVQEISRGDWRLAVVECGERHLRISVDEGLLVDPPDALQRANVEGVLRPAVTRE
jgi:hypothetical protein